VPRFVGLRREAEGHRGHVAVEGRAGHEGHEQQVGQHVLERKRSRQELERAGGARIFEERLGHRQEPHAVVHVAKSCRPLKYLL
jgi:hypothetical protein